MNFSQLFLAWISTCVHSKKRTTCSGLMKTALNNVVLPTLFNVVNNIVQHCWAWISPQSGVTMLNNIVDNTEQCGQHNIVQGCFHQPWKGCAFLRVYDFHLRLNTLCFSTIRFTKVNTREGLETQYNSLSMMVKVYARIRSFIVKCVLYFC